MKKKTTKKIAVKHETVPTAVGKTSPVPGAPLHFELVPNARWSIAFGEDDEDATGTATLLCIAPGVEYILPHGNNVVVLQIESVSVVRGAGDMWTPSVSFLTNGVQPMAEVLAAVRAAGWQVDEKPVAEVDDLADLDDDPPKLNDTEDDVDPESIGRPPAGRTRLAQARRR